MGILPMSCWISTHGPHGQDAHATGLADGITLETVASSERVITWFFFIHLR